MVTIIGGGIAGTVLAGALARQEIPVAVHERQSRAGTGAFLFLDQRAHTALEGLGVSRELLRDYSSPVHGMRVDDNAGDHRTTPGAGRRLHHYADLMTILTDFATTAGADIRYDMALTDIDIDRATLHFGDDTVRSDGLIVGCDGIDSIVRARLEPERTPVHTGQVVVYGSTTRMVVLPTEQSVLHFQIDRATPAPPHNAFGHLWHDRRVVWFARINRPPIPLGDIGFHPVEEWADAVRAAVPDIPKIIDMALRDTESVHVSNARDVPLDDAAPAREDIVLIGDADHAITPAAGIGARDAIEDAAALFEALRTGASPAAAITARRAQVAEEHAFAARMFSGPRR
ncbi:FAD-dependent oxidoreductase [Nocardia sp. NPDC052566]|uniref:FAD-dependent oxidoreductase n=1 Tax=Nocardia sp. NPDC052566 TaxID=3364330 RepID=UPI0037C7D9B1